MNPDNIIKVEKLTKRFGEFVAVDQISMDVGRGQILDFSAPTVRVRPLQLKCCQGYFNQPPERHWSMGLMSIQNLRKSKGISVT